MGLVGDVCLCATLYKLFVDERPSESKVSLSDGLVYCAPSVASADGEFKIKFPLVYCAPSVASADGEFKIKFPLPQHKQEGA